MKTPLIGPISTGRFLNSRWLEISRLSFPLSAKYFSVYSSHERRFSSPSAFTFNTLTNMAFASFQRLRLQVVIAVDNAEGQVTDLRKFLHITQPNETISTLATEVDEKFKKLYPAERYVFI